MFEFIKGSGPVSLFNRRAIFSYIHTNTNCNLSWVILTDQVQHLSCFVNWIKKQIGQILAHLCIYLYTYLLVPNRTVHTKSTIFHLIIEMWAVCLKKWNQNTPSENILLWKWSEWKGRWTKLEMRSLCCCSASFYIARIEFQRRRRMRRR